MTDRRAKSDSLQAQIATRREVQSGIGWPDVVTPPPNDEDHQRVLQIFADILEARPPSLWRKADVICAAHLSLAIQQLDRANQLVERSGFLIKGAGKAGPGSGGLLVNPMLAVVQQLSARVESMSRRLGLAGVGADVKTVQNARVAFADAGGSTFKPKLATKDGEAAPDWAKIAGLAE